MVVADIFFALMHISEILLNVLVEDFVDIVLRIEVSDDLLGLVSLALLQHFGGGVRAKEVDQHCLQEREDPCHGQDDPEGDVDVVLLEHQL